MYELQLARQPMRYLRRLAGRDAKRIRSALDRLAAAPDRTDMDIKPLAGRPGFRVRVGDCRVIYERQDEIRALTIERIALRGDVYKG
ncbi:MAG: type II toxin-antitoxin system RelE/ParE family toxin [Alphaproteobacteria bacterium]